VNSQDVELLKAAKVNLEQLAGFADRAVHHHSRSAEYHKGIAQEKEAQAENVRSIAKEAGIAGANSSHAKLADSLDREASVERAHAVHHENEARQHGELREACQKTMATELHKLDQLVPSQISAVTDPSKGPRAVIRVGQREIPGAGTMPPVDLQFQHLVKATDDRE